MPQLALLFEIAQNPGADEVTAESTELALRWVTEYLDKHAKRIYNLSRPGGESAYHGTKNSHFTAPDVRQKHCRGLGADWEINDAIDALIEWLCLRVAETSGVGRPTTKYEDKPETERLNSSPESSELDSTFGVARFSGQGPTALDHR